MRTLAVSAALAMFADALKASTTTNTEGYTFEHFVAEFGKVYAPTEVSLRQGIFEANMASLRSLQKSRNAKYTVYENMDLSAEERRMMRGYKAVDSVDRVIVGESASIRSSLGERKPLPLSVDWSMHDTPIRNQGECGSCWAQATTAMNESYFSMATDTQVRLSVQQLVDCAPNERHCGGVGGCFGSTIDNALTYLMQTEGQVQEDDYPYIMANGVCNTADKPAVVKVKGFKKLGRNDYHALMEHIAFVGPVAVNMAYDTMEFYAGGIHDACDAVEDAQIDHVMVLVGYGTDPETGLDYWRIRNSFGTTWGEEGYIRVKRSSPEQARKEGREWCVRDSKPLMGVDCETEFDPEDEEMGLNEVTVCGECGIAYDPSAPILDLSVERI